MYLLFILFCTLITLLSFKVFRKEILCPPVIAMLMIEFSAVAGLIEYRESNYNEFSLSATVLLIVGIMSLIFGSMVAYSIHSKSVNSLEAQIMPSHRQRVEVNFLYTVPALFISLATLLLVLRFLLDLAGTGISNIFFAIGRYRYLSKFSEIPLPSNVNLGTQLSEMFGSLSLFIFLHNLTFRVKKRKDIWQLIIILIYILQLILLSLRGSIIMLAGAVIYFVYFFWNIYYGWTQKVQERILRLGIISFSALLVFFILLLVIMGRVETLKGYDVGRELWVYVSAGIRNFDLFIKDPSHIGTTGHETFTNILNGISNIFGVGEFVKRHLEFETINGLNTGNLFTAFRRYYSDFGIFGLFILPGIEGYIFTSMYMRVKRKVFKGEMPFLLFLFVKYSYAMMYIPIDDVFFSSILRIGLIYRIPVYYILFVFITKVKLKVRVTAQRSTI